MLKEFWDDGVGGCSGVQPRSGGGEECEGRVCAFEYAGCEMAEADEGTFNAVRSWDVNGSLESSCQGSG